MKLDAQGNIEWKGFFDLGFHDCAWDAAETADGYIVVGGNWGCSSCPNASSPIARAFVLKLDRSGNQVNLSYIEKGYITSAWSVLGDGEIIAGLAANETGNYVWIGKSNESIIAQRSDFLILPTIYGVVRMTETQDGYFIVSSACGGNCIWFGKFSFKGTLVDERTYIIPEIQENESENMIKVCPHTEDGSAISSPSDNYEVGKTLPGNFNLLFYAFLILIVATTILFVLFKLY